MKAATGTPWAVAPQGARLYFFLDFGFFFGSAPTWSSDFAIHGRAFALVNATGNVT
jgi:hypothetical protein